MTNNPSASSGRFCILVILDIETVFWHVSAIAASGILNFYLQKSEQKEGRDGHHSHVV